MERWQREQKEYRNSLTELLLDKERIVPSDLDECINIERVFIGPKVKTITEGAFMRSPKLAKIEISPENKTFFLDEGCLIDRERNAMIVCLGVPHVPEYIERVNTSVFHSREIADRFFIHKNVKEIQSFERCCRFKELEVASDNACYEVEDGCVFERGGNKIILGGERSVIGSRADTIGSGAFSGCGFTHVEIPSAVKRIDRYAFYNCSDLQRIDFNEGLLEIDAFAFAHDAAVKSISLPQSLTRIGNGAFLDCLSLKSIDSFGGLVEISSCCFQNCGLKTLSVGGKVKKLCDESFWFCRELEEFTACDGLEVLGTNVLCGCEKLKKVTLCDTVKELGASVFGGCESLTEVKLSKALKVIPEKGFYECKNLRAIDFPEGLQKIETWAFYNCAKLERTNAAELKSIKKIYSDAFTGCRKLKKEGLGKKPTKLPPSFYALDCFEDIMRTAKKGESYEFMSDTSLASYLAKFEGGVVLDGKKYLCLRKKDLLFYVEISSELEKDKICECYDVYVCKTVEDGALADKIKEAASLQ